jgi:hypothetical protein
VLQVQGGTADAALLRMDGRTFWCGDEFFSNENGGPPMEIPDQDFQPYEPLLHCGESQVIVYFSLQHINRSYLYLSYVTMPKEVPHRLIYFVSQLNCHEKEILKLETLVNNHKDNVRHKEGC